MSAMARRPGANEWNALLEETRQALATLRAEDLEELAERAQCMLAATVGSDAVRQRLPRPQGAELRALANQNNQLADQLRAIDRNLAVLRRLRNRAGGRLPAKEVN